MFRDHIRKLRPVQESYKPPVDKLQLFFEQKGLDIATLKKNTQQVVSYVYTFSLT